MEGVVVPADTADRGVRRSAEGAIQARYLIVPCAPLLRRVRAAARLRQRPDPRQEAVDPVDTGWIPWPALVPWADEHQEEAYGIRPVAPRQLVGSCDVAARLAHALVVGAQDLTLVAKRQERLVKLELAEISQRLHEEARVHQMQDRVLCATGIQVDREPQFHLLRIPGPLALVRRAVAQEIPARVHEGIHGVRLAPRRAPTHRAGGGQELRMRLQWADPCRREIDLSGQQDRQ